MGDIKNGDLMSNGKKFNRTMNKYSDKKLAKHLYDTHPKVDKTKLYQTKHKLRGEATGRYVGVVFYGVQGFLNSDELDVVVKNVYRDGKEVDINLYEKMEFHSAALNDYFLNHAE